MAQNASPRKTRNKSLLSRQQRLISHYFSPKSGISKEVVNFPVGPGKEPERFQRATEIQTNDSSSNATGDGTAFPRDPSGLTTAARSLKLAKQDNERFERTADHPRSFRRSSLGGEKTWTTSIAGNSLDKEVVHCSGNRRPHFGEQTRVSPTMAPLKANYKKFSSSSNPSSTTSDRRKRSEGSRIRPSTEGPMIPKKRQKRTRKAMDREEEGISSSSDDDSCIVTLVQCNADGQNSSKSSGESSRKAIKRKLFQASSPKCGESRKSSHKGVEEKTDLLSSSNSESSQTLEGNSKISPNQPSSLRSRPNVGENKKSSQKAIKKKPNLSSSRKSSGRERIGSSRENTEKWRKGSLSMSGSRNRKSLQKAGKRKRIFSSSEDSTSSNSESSESSEKNSSKKTKESLSLTPVSKESAKKAIKKRVIVLSSGASTSSDSKSSEKINNKKSKESSSLTPVLKESPKKASEKRVIESSPETSASSDNDSSESSEKISNKKSEESLSVTPVSKESPKKARKKRVINSSPETSTSSDNNSSESSEKISNEKSKKSLSLTPVLKESAKKAIKKRVILSSSGASTSSDNDSSEFSEKVSYKKSKKSLSSTPVLKESAKKAIKKRVILSSSGASTSSDNDSSESSEKVSYKKSKKSLSSTPMSKESPKKASKKRVIVSSSGASTSSDNDSSDCLLENGKNEKIRECVTPMSRGNENRTSSPAAVKSKEHSSSSLNPVSEMNASRKQSLQKTGKKKAIVSSSATPSTSCANERIECSHKTGKKQANNNSSSCAKSQISAKCKKKNLRKTKNCPSASSSWNGLVKDDDESNTEGDSDVNPLETAFSHLPEEIMENIFCQLPMIDLLLNCALVCRQWNNIIARDTFIPWKKKYCRLKKKDAECEEEMTRFLDREGLFEVELFPLRLPSFMRTFKGKRCPSLTENLKTHCKFPLIETFLETFTENSTMYPSTWSVVSLLTLVCQTVYEVQDIVHCLVRSSCLVQDILECFYCLASIFYHLGSQNRIDSGLHYRVYYALYLYENSYQATHSPLDGDPCKQQSRRRQRSLGKKHKLTHEQVRILKHDVKIGEVVKIVAFAGTGKTTTLVQYTDMRPRTKFLNVVYNKSTQMQAVEIFPSNVESRTIHSLAYKAVGFRYKDKLAFAVSARTIMNALPSECGFLHARRVEGTLKNFLASTNTTVKTKHIPPARVYASDLLEESALFGDQERFDEAYFQSEIYLKKVKEHTARLWERMKDVTDTEFPITHDGYLKVFQLSRPVLDWFDCLLIDEAQDCTPAVADILLSQDCAKILVGDPHQQIYAFRGAKNALQEVQSTHTFYLTQSFRFGPEIAYVASSVLDVLKSVRDKTLVGGARKGSVLGETSGQMCVITRCNLTLFNETVRVCSAQNDTKVGFVGGIRSLGLARIADIHKLFVCGPNNPLFDIKDPMIKKFRSFHELKKYAVRAHEPDLLGKIKIVEKHGAMLKQRIEEIKSKAVDNLHDADIVFSTAHKAKGLEFDTVRITDDFLPGSDAGMISLQSQAEDEKNLVYVAVSRARKCLQLNGTLLRILACRMEHFLKAVPQADLSQPSICIQCMVEISPSPSDHVAVEKEDITLGGNIKVPGGRLCSACAIKKAPHLGSLIHKNLSSNTADSENS